MSDVAGFRIETDVPIPGRVRTPERIAMDALVEAGRGASVLFPWIDKRDPEQQAKALGRYAERCLGRGGYALRRVQGGIRVWNVRTQP